MPTSRKKFLINIYRIKLYNNKLFYERSTTGLDFLMQIIFFLQTNLVEDINNSLTLKKFDLLKLRVVFVIILFI